MAISTEERNLDPRVSDREKRRDACGLGSGYTDASLTCVHESRFCSYLRCERQEFRSAWPSDSRFAPRKGRTLRSARRAAFEDIIRHLNSTFIWSAATLQVVCGDRRTDSSAAELAVTIE